MAQTRRGPWTIRAERTAYENPWIRVSEYDVLRPDGSPGLYGVVQPKFIAVGVVPVFDNGDTLLVGQHRFALDAHSWECPEGGGPKDGDPLDTARRELAEETGWRAETYQEICSFDVSNSVTNEQAVGYLATGLEPGAPDRDASEADMEVRRVPFHQAYAMAMSGEIRDGFSIILLSAAAHIARTGGLDRALAARMLPDEFAGAAP
jgi:8-oxo-dGTP pyrophosphatase MutT (NUDIX family)